MVESVICHLTIIAYLITRDSIVHQIAIFYPPIIVSYKLLYKESKDCRGQIFRNMSDTIVMKQGV